MTKNTENAMHRVSRLSEVAVRNILILFFVCVGFVGKAVAGSFDYLPFAFAAGLPGAIIADDLLKPVYAELPSGEVELKTYRVSLSVIDEYSKQEQIEKGDVKDNLKAPECTRAELRALREYTSGGLGFTGADRINYILRKIRRGRVDGEIVDRKSEIRILVTASGANCVPRYTGPVFRWENTPPKILEQYQPGNYIFPPAFTSTTQGASGFSFFKDRKQKIVIRNAKGADLSLPGTSTFPEEKEALIAPGTNFKVISRKDNPVGTLPQNEFEFEQVE